MNFHITVKDYSTGPDCLFDLFLFSAPSAEFGSALSWRMDDPLVVPHAHKRHTLIHSPKAQARENTPTPNGSACARTTPPSPKKKKQKKSALMAAFPIKSLLWVPTLHFLWLCNSARRCAWYFCCCSPTGTFFVWQPTSKVTYSMLQILRVCGSVCVQRRLFPQYMLKSQHTCPLHKTVFTVMNCLFSDVVLKVTYLSERNYVENLGC